ncbi:MAG TPA: M24 family metallopeptidase [Gemmatimonadaceae bacterium]|nr:M24 family metallopeptidase [Gemmatimonadaceae bacterium]
MLTRESLPEVQRALAEAGLDGWLLFDFQGTNPIANGMLALEGMVTRRVLAWVPRQGTPVAVTHAIEQSQWRRWPAEWRREVYGSWSSLEGHLRTLLAGKRVAMEYSPGDAVPYLDRVPAGVVEMVRAAGAEVVSSGDLVSRFYAVWSREQLASHRRAAEAIAAIARDAFALAGERARGRDPAGEHELCGWILDRFARAGLETEKPPHPAAGANAADPHYEPAAGRERRVVDGDVLLVDLWAREPGGGVYADQTWMGTVGAPSARAAEVWGAVRDARDAAIAFVRERIAGGTPVRGRDVDDAARWVLEQRGFGRQFIHRTGHSIDPRSLHGAGPNLDNLETRDERRLIPGVGFSIEPGVYLPGEIGMRAEVNAYVGEGEVVITPAEYQRELIVV